MEVTSPSDWMKKQTRFHHVFQPGNEWMLKAVKENVEKEWQELLKMSAGARKVRIK